MPRTSQHDDVIELQDETSGSAATIVPRRGAIVSRFRAGGRELLYMDEATLRDPTKNVRGGVPLLFPSPGKLTGDRFAQAGRSGAMKQHGFARDAAWTVRPFVEVGAASATFEFEASDATRAMYPWSFALALTISLTGPVLRLDLSVSNADREPMPFGFGIHPYFLVSDKGRARIDTPATRAFDNVTKTTGPFRGFDLTAKEVDLHLVDHGGSSCSLHLGDGEWIDVRGSQELSRWVVWTLAGKDFVCVEPWTAPGDALNTGDSLIVLEPGGTRRLWIEIEHRAG
jgi:galactose mutarotase-like enzyme